ncbi:hypothetical protein Mal15_45470 [Stieleria maiorica]|uniref:Uncharacterized protein n=1 Tax=Stieleria maiorica TaxID=2795974 RepID=A0A5B9MKG2_9BACT|nr:hypothetical protein [Stieleria maiorica]QEG00477.1 hypothetical protein Mal15_45470 [Stieleria maiorica]
MNRFIRPTMVVVLLCCLITGCSDGPQNITQNASQEEIDNYNALIEQAEKEMQGDGEVEDLEE